jgi:hypothetical protein
MKRSDNGSVISDPRTKYYEPAVNFGRRFFNEDRVPANSGYSDRQEKPRFGSPKSQARFMSSTLLDTVLHTAFRLSDRVIVIVGQLAISLHENIIQD